MVSIEILDRIAQALEYDRVSTLLVTDAWRIV